VLTLLLGGELVFRDFSRSSVGRVTKILVPRGTKVLVLLGLVWEFVRDFVAEEAVDEFFFFSELFWLVPLLGDSDKFFARLFVRFRCGVSSFFKSFSKFSVLPSLVFAEVFFQFRSSAAVTDVPCTGATASRSMIVELLRSMPLDSRPSEDESLLGDNFSEKS